MNDHGTACLCANRSGHLEVVRLLVQSPGLKKDFPEIMACNPKVPVAECIGTWVLSLALAGISVAPIRRLCTYSTEILSRILAWLWSLAV